MSKVSATPPCRTSRVARGALALLLVLPAPVAVAPSTARALGGDSPSPTPGTDARNCRCDQVYSKRYGKCVRRRCGRGKMWSCKARKCVRRTSGLLSDEDLYREGVRLAKAERFAEALALLQRIRDKKQARVLNYIGYATRKLGDVDAGIAYYRKALALDPDYVVAREYLGEGFLQKGDLDGARRELAEIEKRCGTTCHAYEELAKEIAAYLARRPARAGQDGAL